MTDYKLSQLTPLAVTADDDLLPIVDIHDTSTPPAGAAGSDKRITVGAFRSLTPSGDLSGVTDTANIAAAMAVGKPLSLGTFSITNLLPDSYALLAGSGYGTILQPAAGTTGYAIALKTPAATKQVTLRDFTLDCNKVCGGIQLDNTGFTPAGSFVPFDPLHSLRNLLVLAANGDALHMDNNARGLDVINFRSYFASGYGMYLGPGAGAGGAGCTDSKFVDCITGISGIHGVFVAPGSSNNSFIGLKSFWSGYNESTATWGTTGCGLELQGSWNKVTGSDFQQNALHGIDMQACADCTVTGNSCDTNSAGTAGGVGINLNAALRCAVGMNSGSNNAGLSPGAQKYGVQVAGTQTGTTIYGNTVTGASGDFNYVSGFGYELISAAQVGMWQAVLFQSPGQILATSPSVQALTTGATITPTAAAGTNYGVYPVSSTANVTGIILAAPPNGTGSQITIINTTAFTIAFSASVADGAASAIPANTARAFTYDGTLWYRTA